MRISKTTDSKENMCDYCLNEFHSCTAGLVEFGNGLGNDNVISCEEYNGPKTETIQINGKPSNA